MENLPILQDFVPYWGRCPASPHETKEKIEKGKRTADYLMPGGGGGGEGGGRRGRGGGGGGGRGGGGGGGRGGRKGSRGEKRAEDKKRRLYI